MSGANPIAPKEGCTHTRSQIKSTTSFEIDSDRASSNGKRDSKQNRKRSSRGRGRGGARRPPKPVAAKSTPPKPPKPTPEENAFKIIRKYFGAVLEVRKEQQAQCSPDTVAKHRQQKKNLKSDLKKSLAFVKKVNSMNLTSEKVQSILKDINSVNFSRYAVEVAAALTGPALRSADIPSVVAIALAMHQKYPDFLRAMLNNLLSSLRAALKTALMQDQHLSSKSSSNSARQDANVALFTEILPILKQAKSRVNESNISGVGDISNNDMGLGLGGLGMDAAPATGVATRDIGDKSSDVRSAKLALNRCRVLMCLALELIVTGVWTDTQFFVGLISALSAGSGITSSIDNPSSEANYSKPINVLEIPKLGEVSKKATRKAVTILPFLVPVLKYGSSGSIIGPDGTVVGDDVIAAAQQREGADESMARAVLGVPTSQYSTGILPRCLRQILSKVPEDSRRECSIIASLPLYRNESTLNSFSRFVADEQSQMRCALNNTYAHAVVALQADYEALKRLEQRCQNAEFNRGDIPESLSQSYAAAQQYHERLKGFVESFGELIDAPDFQLHDPELEDETPDQGTLNVWDGSREGAVALGPFEDEATRAFYMDIPNLRDTIPSILLDTKEESAAKAAAQEQKGRASEQGANHSIQSTSKPEESLLGAASGFKNPKTQRGTLESALKQFAAYSQDATSNSSARHQAPLSALAARLAQTEPAKPISQSELPANEACDEETSEEDSAEIGSDEDTEPRRNRFASWDSETEGPNNATDDSNTEDSAMLHGSKASFDALMVELPHCVNKDLLDAWAQDFVMRKHFNKRGRALLLRHISSVKPNSSDLFPYYARLVAILSKASPGFAQPLIENFEDELKYLLKKKRSSHLDLKLRTVRMISELCKFGVAPPNMVFRCMSRCLRDFSGHAIEALSALLEGCGRYLYMLQQTRQRLVDILNAMQKLRDAKHMDDLYKSLIDNAYYACIPQQCSVMTEKRKQRDPMHEYIRFLLIHEQSRLNQHELVLSLRKLPWKTQPGQIYSWLRGTFIKVIPTSITTSEKLAGVLGELTRYHEDICMHILDDCLHILLNGLESSGSDDLYSVQRRIALCRFVGSLYLVRMLDTKQLLRIMYYMLNFGHAMENPEDAIRAVYGYAAVMEARKKRNQTKQKYTKSRDGQHNSKHKKEETDTEPPITMEEMQAVNMQSIFPNSLIPPDPREPRTMCLGHHPLIPYPSDPMTNMHRIHMICTILQSVRNVFARGVARSRVDDFLTHFQRYVLSKDQLPADTEMVVNDTFEMIRPRWQFARTFEEAQKAAAAVEVREAKILAAEYASAMRKRARAADQKMSGTQEDHDIAEGEDISQDEESLFDEEDDQVSISSEDGASTEQDELEYGRRDHLYRSEADEEFERQLAQLERESVEQRNLASARVNAEHMNIPYFVKQQLESESQIHQGSTPAAASRNMINSSQVAFTLLRRKTTRSATATSAGAPAGRVETKLLYIPGNVPLAARSTQVAEVARREREELKRVTLAMQDRQEEEERYTSAAEREQAAMRLKNDLLRREEQHSELSEEASQRPTGGPKFVRGHGRGRGGSRARDHARGR